MFGDGAFTYIVDWAQTELHIDLVTCAANSHVPRAENAIQFAKERVRSVQSETPFDRYPKIFTIKLLKRVVVLINSFRRKSGVHPVMSPNQILFGKKFNTPLCKIGELVMVYDVTADNKTTIPRAFYALYIGPNNSGTCNQVFKLSTMRIVTSLKCKSIPMPDNIIEVVNDLGRQDGMPSGIEFRNIHHESTLADLFADKDLNDDNSNASHNDWGLNKNHKVDLQKITFDNHVDGTEVQDLNIANEDILQLYDGSDLSRNIGVQHNQEDQPNHFGAPAANEDDLDKHLEDYVEGDTVNEGVD